MKPNSLILATYLQYTDVTVQLLKLNNNMNIIYCTRYDRVQYCETPKIITKYTGTRATLRHQIRQVCHLIEPDFASWLQFIHLNSICERIFDHGLHSILLEDDDSVDCSTSAADRVHDMLQTHDNSSSYFNL